MFTTTTKKSPQQQLMERSKSVFDTFGKQLEELTSINSSMVALEEEKQREVEAIQQQISEIASQRSANEKLAGKIAEFIS